MKQVSVVMPTYRRPELLRRCLEALLAQDFDPLAYEIVVADDGHDDATQALVESLQPSSGAPRLRYLRPASGRGPAVARNAGWRAADAPLIAFTDDDTVPDRRWLACGVAAMRDPALVALCGRVRVPASQPPTDHELMTLGLEKAEFVTANAFVRRDALQRVGGFDERFERPWREDSDLQFRLMCEVGPVGRCADATVVHPVRPERWGVCLRQQKNALFDALLYKKHPRLYRERIDPRPPWHYFAIVGAAVAAPLLWLAGASAAAATALAIALLLVLRFAWRRLRHTARTPAHVLEMLATSALIPFLSVYWRLRGAWRWRVLFL
jgi:glycosyltransferase involved in cell wall biosynthesis